MKKIIFSIIAMGISSITYGKQIDLVCIVTFTGNPSTIYFSVDQERPFWLLQNGNKTPIIGWKVTNEYIAFTEVNENPKSTDFITIFRDTGNITIRTLLGNGLDLEYLGKCEAKKPNKF